MMNSLTILIYFIGLFSNLQTFLQIFLVIIGFCTAAYTIVYAASVTDPCNLHPLPFYKWPYILVASLSLILVIIPDKQTITLMASSEIGQRILDNPKTAEITDPAFKILKNWLETNATK